MSFLANFKNLEKVKDKFFFVGNDILVELIDVKPPKSKSGLILDVGGAVNSVVGMHVEKPVLARVLLVGNGRVDEKGNDIPVQAAQGDIVLISQYAPRRYPFFGPLVAPKEESICIINEDAIQMRFFGEEAYRDVYEALNGV